MVPRCWPPVSVTVTHFSVTRATPLESARRGLSVSRGKVKNGRKLTELRGPRGIGPKFKSQEIRISCGAPASPRPPCQLPIRTCLPIRGCCSSLCPSVHVTWSVRAGAPATAPPPPCNALHWYVPALPSLLVTRSVRMPCPFPARRPFLGQSHPLCCARLAPCATPLSRRAQPLPLCSFRSVPCHSPLSAPPSALPACPLRPPAPRPLVLSARHAPCLLPSPPLVQCPTSSLIPAAPLPHAYTHYSRSACPSLELIPSRPVPLAPFCPATLPAVSAFSACHPLLVLPTPPSPLTPSAPFLASGLRHPSPLPNPHPEPTTPTLMLLFTAYALPSAVTAYALRPSCDPSMMRVRPLYYAHSPLPSAVTLALCMYLVRPLIPTAYIHPPSRTTDALPSPPILKLSLRVADCRGSIFP
ncbi:unnamed protein product [Cyclocybe aegerita]|uniref:Uncharacterized protein n=1 Tax=Cyclocybe aegerita TaxID=1973307 RepID=A0A8S0WZR6_CYCAE|nr:unnamed protein product [Cyclocybe aegerita]